MPKFPNNFRFLKAKLQSYESFYGIARSIQLVAFAKLKKLRKKIESRFISLRFVKTVLSNYYRIEIGRSIVSKDSVIMYCTSDKSCCGSINYPVVNKTLKLMSVLISHSGDVILFPIGAKGFNILKRQYRRNMKFFAYDVEQSVSFFIGAHLLHNSIRNIHYDDLYLIFTRFIDNFTQQVVFYKLPSYISFLNTLFCDRDANSVLDLFVNKHLVNHNFTRTFHNFMGSLVILDSLEETVYSQLGAKAKTMDLALKSVGDTINLLRVKYNKVRQAIITNDIIEVLNASVAILE